MKTFIFGLLVSALALTLTYGKTFAQLPYSDYYSLRGGLHGFYAAVKQKKKVTVGFLGGSLTFNPGWREKVCAYLTARFPETTITKWSGWLHLPWFILFGSGLPPGGHELQLRIGGAKDPKSKGYACRMVHFLVNR